MVAGTLAAAGLAISSAATNLYIIMAAFGGLTGNEFSL